MLVGGYAPSLDDLKLFASDLLFSRASVQLRRVWNSSLNKPEGSPFGDDLRELLKYKALKSKASGTVIGFKRQGCLGPKHKPE